MIQGPGPDLGWPGGREGAGEGTQRWGDRVRDDGEGGGGREEGWGRRGGEKRRHCFLRIRCFSAPSSYQEEQFGCTFTPKPAKLFSHRNKKSPFPQHGSGSIADSFDTKPVPTPTILRLQKYRGLSLDKMSFHVNHGDSKVSLSVSEC